MYFNVLKGVGISYLFTIISFVIFALVLSFTNLSDSLIPGMILLISVLGILIGSVSCGKKASSQGFVWGGMVGLTYSVILYILSSFTLVGFTSTLSAVYLILFSAIFGALGGVIGINIKH